MKRVLKFSCDDSQYYIEESGVNKFQINKSDLKFNSLKFYNNIFKGVDNYQDITIELTENLNNDGIAKYIFAWLKEIIAEICCAINVGLEPPIDNELEEVVSLSKKTIKLFTLSACAGDGNYIYDAENAFIEYEVENFEADYAVKISGDSMEPSIKDGSVVLVLKTVELKNNDTGIFLVNGDVMCKKYIKEDERVILCPENSKYKKIEIFEDTEFIVQGKVLEVVDDI